MDPSFRLFFVYIIFSLFALTGGIASAQEASKDYYEILGVSESASQQEITKAYRRLAMKHHPDRLSDIGTEKIKEAEQKFREITEAYEILKDLNTRAKYDQWRKSNTSSKIGSSDFSAYRSEFPWRTAFDLEKESDFASEMKERTLSKGEVLVTSYRGSMQFRSLSSDYFDSIEERTYRNLFIKNFREDITQFTPKKEKRNIEAMIKNFREGITQATRQKSANQNAQFSEEIKQTGQRFWLYGRFWMFQDGESNKIPALFETDRGEFLVVSKNGEVFRFYEFEKTKPFWFSALKQRFKNKLRTKAHRLHSKNALVVYDTSSDQDSNRSLPRVNLSALRNYKLNSPIPSLLGTFIKASAETTPKEQAVVFNNSDVRGVNRWTPESVNRMTTEEVHELFFKRSASNASFFQSAIHNTGIEMKNFPKTTFAFYVASGAIMYATGMAGPDPVRSISDMVASPVGLFSFYAFVQAAGLMNTFTTYLEGRGYKKMDSVNARARHSLGLFGYTKMPKQLISKFVIGGIQIMKTPLALSAGMYASILLQEYFTDPDVKKCNQTPTKDRDYTWIQACNRVYHNWTFGNKFSTHSRDLLGLIAAGTLSHYGMKLGVSVARAGAKKITARKFSKHIRRVVDWLNFKKAVPNSFKVMGWQILNFLPFLGIHHVLNDWLIHPWKKIASAEEIGDQRLDIKESLKSAQDTWSNAPQDACIVQPDPREITDSQLSDYQANSIRGMLQGPFQLWDWATAEQHDCPGKPEADEVNDYFFQIKIWRQLLLQTFYQANQQWNVKTQEVFHSYLKARNWFHQVAMEIIRTDAEKSSEDIASIVHAWNQQAQSEIDLRRRSDELRKEIDSCGIDLICHIKVRWNSPEWQITSFLQSRGLMDNLDNHLVKLKKDRMCFGLSCAMDSVDIYRLQSEFPLATKNKDGIIINQFFYQAVCGEDIEKENFQLSHLLQESDTDGVVDGLPVFDHDQIGNPFFVMPKLTKSDRPDICDVPYGNLRSPLDHLRSQQVFVEYLIKHADQEKINTDWWNQHIEPQYLVLHQVFQKQYNQIIDEHYISALDSDQEIRTVAENSVQRFQREAMMSSGRLDVPIVSDSAEAHHLPEGILDSFTYQTEAIFSFLTSLSDSLLKDRVVNVDRLEMCYVGESREIKVRPIFVKYCESKSNKSDSDCREQLLDECTPDTSGWTDSNYDQYVEKIFAKDLVSLLEIEALELIQQLKDSSKDFLNQSKKPLDDHTFIMEKLEQIYEKNQQLNDQKNSLLFVLSYLLHLPKKDSSGYQSLEKKIRDYASYFHAPNTDHPLDDTTVAHPIRQFIFNDCMKSDNIKNCNVSVLSPFNQMILHFAHQFISMYDEFKHLNGQIFIFLSTFYQKFEQDKSVENSKSMLEMFQKINSQQME